jgi:ribosomal protein L12E/L44/L45/RPP1/RPP2
MKVTRILLLLAALGLVLWLTLAREGATTASAVVPAGSAASDEAAVPASALDVKKEAERLRDTAQEVPCRPGDPLCAPAAPAQ